MTETGRGNGPTRNARKKTAGETLQTAETGRRNGPIRNAKELLAAAA